MGVVTLGILQILNLEVSENPNPECVDLFKSTSFSLQMQ